MGKAIPPAGNPQTINPGVNNNPNPIQFPPPAIQFPPPAEQFPPPAMQFPPPAEQFPPQEEQFPPQEEQFPPLEEQFPPSAEQFPPFVGRPQIAQIMPHSNGVITPGIPIFTETWRTQLFDCMDDPTNAIMTCCFPCVTFGQIAEILDKGQTPCATSGIVYSIMAVLPILSCIYTSTYRLKLRNKFGLMETPAPDWITHLFCESCALSQAYRELQHRGIDPTIGWIGNVAKLQQMQRQQQAGLNPPQIQTMRG